jgi:hypothetical protein
MTQVLKAKIKREGDKFWDDVGLTVFIKDNGNVSIRDARTGEWYQCFAPKPKSDDGPPPDEAPWP